MANTYTKNNSNELKLYKTKCKTSFKHEIKKKTKLYGVDLISLIKLQH